MKKNHKNLIKYIVLSFLVVIGIGTQLSLEATHFNGVEANRKPEYAEQLIKPGHHKAYKLGMANDVEMSFDNYIQIEEKNRGVRQERITQKQIEKENAEKAKQAAIEKARQVEKEEEAKQIAEQEAAREQQEVVVAQTSSQSVSSNEIENTKSTVTSPKETHSFQSTAEAPAPKAVTRTVSQSAPAPKPQAASTIGPSKIGINGNYHSYTNYGRATTEQLQIGIDAGLIVAGFSHFNGNDGETTYFGGHNPGIMWFMEKNIHVGAIVTVTDDDGQAHQYKMIDKVDVDEYGEGVLSTIGRSAIDVYMYGTGTESILVQFCNTNNYLMSFWYGVKL